MCNLAGVWLTLYMYKLCKIPETINIVPNNNQLTNEVAKREWLSEISINLIVKREVHFLDQVEIFIQFHSLH